MVDLREPDFTKTQDIHAFLFNVFGGCGCSELTPMVDTIKELLAWAGSDGMERTKWTRLGYNAGAYYILMGIMDNADLIDHGSAIRAPFLTDKGKSFLNALNKFAVEEIRKCPAEPSYDGLSYGVFEA